MPRLHGSSSNPGYITDHTGCSVPLSGGDSNTDYYRYYFPIVVKRPGHVEDAEGVINNFVQPVKEADPMGGDEIRLNFGPSDIVYLSCFPKAFDSSEEVFLRASCYGETLFDVWSDETSAYLGTFDFRDMRCPINQVTDQTRGGELFLSPPPHSHIQQMINSRYYYQSGRVEV